MFASGFRYLVVLMCALVFSEMALVRADDASLPQTIEDATKLIEQNPGKAESYAIRGHLYQCMECNNEGEEASKKDFEHAAADFDKAIELDPNNPQRYYDRGACYKGKNPGFGDGGLSNDGEDAQLLDQSLSYIDQAIKLDPKFFFKEDDRSAYEYRAKLHIRQKRLELAIADYDQMLKVFPERKEIYAEKVAGLREDIYEAFITAEAVRLSEPIALTAREQFTEAIAAADHLLAADPKDVGAYMVRADTWFSAKETAKSIADYETVLKLDPKYGSHDQRDDMLDRLCAAYVAAGHYEKAIALVDRFTELSTASPELARYSDAQQQSSYQIRKGRIYMAARQIDKAIEAYSAAIKSDESSFDPYIERAGAYAASQPPRRDLAATELVNTATRFKQKRHYESEYTVSPVKAAIDFYSDWIKLEPENGELYMHRAQLNKLDGKFAEAGTDYGKAAELAEKSHLGRVTMLLEQAHCEFTTKDFKAAAQTYREILKTKPDDAIVRVLLATALNRGSEFQEAIDALKNVAKDAPEFKLAEDQRAAAEQGLAAIAEANKPKLGVDDVEKRPLLGIDDIPSKPVAAGKGNKEVGAAAAVDTAPRRHTCWACELRGARYTLEEQPDAFVVERRELVRDSAPEGLWHERTVGHMEHMPAQVKMCPICGGTGWIED